MDEPEVLEAPPARHRGRRSAGCESGSPGWSRRAPATVRTKLLVAFLVIAALLVLVGVLGLRVLGQANARVERLDALQLRAAPVPGARGARCRPPAVAQRARRGRSEPGDLHRRQDRSRDGAAWTLADLQVADVAVAGRARRRRADCSGSSRRPADERSLKRIRLDYATIATCDGASHAARRAPTSGATAWPVRRYTTARVAERRHQRAGAATSSAQNGTATALVAQNRSALHPRRATSSSRSARRSVALALALGLLLSWSLVGPIQRTEARLAEIAAGDFSGTLDVPNRDELGSLAANVNRMNDELRRVYGELETASRHKSEFLANMSHELRTPLNAIIGFSQVLQQQLFGEINEKQAEYLDDILSSGNHLLSLINDVLDLSKVEAGQVELEVAPILAARGARARCRDGARARDPERRRARRSSSRRTSTSSAATSGGIRQVVFNLLSNAVKFTPAGGRVDVATAATSTARCSVVGRRHRPGHRPRGPRARSSRSSSRPTSARTSARAPASGSRSRSASSSCTAAGSGSRASPARGSRFVFTLPGRRAAVDGRRAASSSSRTTRRT